MINDLGKLSGVFSVAAGALVMEVNHNKATGDFEESYAVKVGVVGEAVPLRLKLAEFKANEAMLVVGNTVDVHFVKQVTLWDGQQKTKISDVKFFPAGSFVMRTQPAMNTAGDTLQMPQRRAA